MKDNRRQDRNKLDSFLNVFDRTSDQLLGYMADFSGGGIMLISKEPLEVGETYRCKAVLSHKVEGQGQIVFDAESRWCGHDPNLYALYNIGLQFKNISRKHAEVIEEWYHEAILPEMAA